MLKVGDKVKDFTLFDSNNRKHTLSNYLGKKVIVYIYPKNNTPGCNAQACSFRDEMDLYNNKDIVVLGISKDNLKSHVNFQNKFNLNFPTLSDESLETIKYFGAFGEKKMFGKTFLGVKRMTFIIDEKGYLIYKMAKVKANTNALDILNILKRIENEKDN